MSDEIDKFTQPTGFGKEDTVYKRKQRQCPHCKEILHDAYLGQNPFPEIPCPSCGALLQIDGLPNTEFPAPDQRSEPRCPAVLKVSYKTYDEFIDEYTKNVSRQGMFISTKRAHEMHDVVDLFLHVPGLPDPVHIIGEVIRVNIKTGTDEDAGVGVKFIDIDEKSRQILISYIKSQE
jgi:uncharacterized protein (TIGR02266 family)